MTPIAAAQAARAQRESAYAAGSLIGKSGRAIPTFPTGVTREPGEALLAIAMGMGARRTIETGCALGMSTLFLAEAVLLNAAKANTSDAQHVAIDPYQMTNWDGVGAQQIAAAGLESVVELIEEDSALALPALVRDRRTFDLGFVDGGHFFEHAWLDIYFMLRLVKPGGLVLVDDYHLPAIRAAINFFVLNLGVRPCVPRDIPGANRFVILEVPASIPSRADDHFAPFGPTGGIFTIKAG